mgnify:FL=1
MRLAFVAVFAFAAGVLLRDVAQDYKPIPESSECRAAQENADRYATLIAHVLNGGGLVVEDSTAVSCRAKHFKEKA